MIELKIKDFRKNFRKKFKNKKFLKFTWINVIYYKIIHEI